MKLRRLIFAASMFCASLAWAQGMGEKKDARAHEVLLEGLGTYHFAVATTSGEAQQFFDQGLRLIYAFNLEEAQRSFEEASQRDPACAMAYWGIALSLGPNINLPALPDRAKAAYEAAQHAKALGGGSARERALISAIGQRYAEKLPESKEGQVALDKAYADAMREATRQFEGDPDICTLFAESMMDLRPWDLWTHDGSPQPGTDEIIATLEHVLAANAMHPGANHYYIHTMEGSPRPERAMASADKLGAMMPGAGHLVHMPAHIYNRVGRYEDACEANRRASRVDQKYYEQLKAAGLEAPQFYPMYTAHNYQFLAFSAMMEGRKAESLKATRDMVAVVPLDMFKEMPEIDCVLAMPVLMLARFGEWDRVLAEPKPEDFLTFPTALWHYSRGLAFCAKGDEESAQKELDALSAAVDAAPADVRKFQNSAKDLLTIGRDVLGAEVALAQGKADAAIEKLGQAVKGEDGLVYDEPPDWYPPVRQALGAALLKAKRPEQATAVYREDLKRNPGSVWSLTGLLASLKAQKQDEEAAKVEKQLREASKFADMEVTASWP